MAHVSRLTTQSVQVITWPHSSVQALRGASMQTTQVRSVSAADGGATAGVDELPASELPPPPAARAASIIDRIVDSSVWPDESAVAKALVSVSQKQAKGSGRSG